MSTSKFERPTRWLQLRSWLRRRARILVAVVVASAVVAAAGWVWWSVIPAVYPPYTGPPVTPEVAATRDATRNQAIVTTRASVLAALAGLAALVTIAINLRNSNIQSHTLATTQDTFRVTERGHLTDRYAKAIEQIGHDSIAIRLGGIYALQQLAVDTGRDSDQATVVEVLSAFVRLNLNAADEPSREPRDQDESSKQSTSRRPTSVVIINPLRLPWQRPAAGRPTQSRKPRADVLAAISVLAQLPVRHGSPMRVDFSGLDFTGLDLSNVRIAGGDLSGANLAGANLADANLAEANLADADFFAADLRGADLGSADLSRAILISADLREAALSGAKLRDAKLSGASLCDANLCDANLIAALLNGADLTGASLLEAHLGRAHLDGANLTQARLVKAVFSSANLEGADFTEAQFFEAKLAHANLRGANLSGADLAGADLSDADLHGADLSRATVSQDQLATTRGKPRRGVDGSDSPAAD